MLKKLTETEEELISFIQKNFSGRYTEIQITPKHKPQRYLTLWFATEEVENVVLDVKLPACAYQVTNGDYIFIPHSFPLNPKFVD